MHFLRHTQAFIAAVGLCLGLGLVSLPVQASGIPDDLMELFTKKPPVRKKNAGAKIPKAYDINQALREDHVHKLYQDSKDYLYALDNLQIVLIIDHSASQGNYDKDPEDTSAGKWSTKPGLLHTNIWTQWDNTYKAAKYLAEAIFRADKNGEVPVYFFSNEVRSEIAEDTVDLFRLFNDYKPLAGSNLLAALAEAFKDHAKLNPDDPDERTLFVILTDGMPMAGQEKKIKELIAEKIVEVDPEGQHLNLLFLRVGDDKNAKRFLKELDDSTEVGHNVDTKADNMIYHMGPENLFLNAMFEHLEKNSRYAEECGDDHDNNKAKAKGKSSSWSHWLFPWRY